MQCKHKQEKIIKSFFLMIRYFTITAFTVLCPCHNLLQGSPSWAAHDIYPECRRSTEAAWETQGLTRSKVTGHPNQGLVVEQVQVWAGCKKVSVVRSGQVRKRACCPLGLVKGDKKIRVCHEHRHHCSCGERDRIDFQISKWNKIRAKGFPMI